MKTRAGEFIGIVLIACVAAQSVAAAAGKLPISGQVVDYLARPVEGAEVTVYQSERRYDDYFARSIAPVVRTDANGRFELEADCTSQYDTFIVARKEGLALAWDGLNYGSNTLERGHFLLVLEKPCTLEGMVVDANGAPVTGAKVQAVPKTSYLSRLEQRPIYGPAEWFTVQTDEKGVFRFGAFSADVSADFRIQAPGWNCTYAFTTHYQNCCGFETDRSDIRLVMPQERQVQGRAVKAETGQGVENVELVIATRRDREDVSNRYLAQTLVTGADGAFICAGLPEGAHRISVAADGTKTPQWIAEPVDVTVVGNRAVENVHVSLGRGGLIQAIVRERDTNRPLSGIRVTAAGTYAVTDDKGRASIRAPAGEHGAYCGGGAYQWWNSGEPIVVETGQVTPLQIVLDPSARLQGTVTDPQGRPVEDALIAVLPYGDRVYTDRAGRFIANYEHERAGEGLWVFARARTRALAAVTHVTRLQEPVALSLGPAATVIGRATDPNGNGIPAARAMLHVLLRLDMGNYQCSIGEEVLADAQGRFEFKAVPPAQEPFDYSISMCATDFAPGGMREFTFAEEAGATANVGPIELAHADMSISGVVVDANGMPAPRVILMLNGRDGALQPRKSTATDEQGRFRITRIAKGPIHLQVNFSSSPGGMGTVRAEAGAQGIRAVLGQRVVHEPFASLLGKPLPEWTDLGLDPLEADARDKMILLCFFDFQQRPSRNAVLQLARQADALAQQGVLVVGVQAPKVEQAELNAWAEQSDVPFPLVRIAADAEATRALWGVKSLPWLILTDSNHIVTAEGFAVAELEKRLATIGENP
ncbi:MAG: carboxypeptidase regulatory-like domain-containing protein [Sedimentisphaerales bacterium]|nr:carboxypeptidase regulatory-like domain-containing protein [Sedimentisphaerales bacterium]